MIGRKGIERRIDKERQKVKELREQIERTESFIGGLQEALKILPRDGDDKLRKGKGIIRPGSDMAKIRDLLKQNGKPMYIAELVKGIGKPETKASRMSIAGSLGRYVRNGEVFKRVGPNLFALIDMDVPNSVELPQDFGLEEKQNIPSNDNDIPF